MDILVVLESAQGSLHRLSKEAIVGAQELGGTCLLYTSDAADE